MSDLKLPATVLLSHTTQEGAGWQKLNQHVCGGFSRKSIDAYIYVLTILPAMQEMIDDIQFEQFLGDLTKSLDDGVSDKQRNEYRAFLMRNSVTISDENLSSLTQAAYPMDASEKNLLTLTGKKIEIDLVGLQIVVLSDNCA